MDTWNAEPSMHCAHSAGMKISYHAAHGGWQQGRSIRSAASLTLSLTWMLHGTALWDTGLAREARTSVAQTDGILSAVRRPLYMMEGCDAGCLYPLCGTGCSQEDRGCLRADRAGR